MSLRRPASIRSEPRYRHRLAGVFLVSREGHDDLGVVEGASVAQSLQREEDHQIAPLHVLRARSVANIAFATEMLKRTIGLEHGVQMPDHEDSLAAIPLQLREQMITPLQFRRLLDPASRKTQSSQLTLEIGADPPDALGVHGAAVDVDDLFEGSDGLLTALVHRLDNLGLSRIQAYSVGRRHCEETQQYEGPKRDR